MTDKEQSKKTAEDGSAPSAPKAFERTMKARHLIMLSLGGVIGTGLFRKSYSKLLEVFSDFFPHFTRVRAAFSKVGCIQLKPLEGQ